MCKKSSAIPTGFPALDAALNGGLRPGLTLVAGRPGMGKTSFMECLARNLLSRGTVWAKGPVFPDAVGGMIRAAAQNGSVLFLDGEAEPDAGTIKTLSGMAKESQVPVLVAAKISPAADRREDKRPRLSDLDPEKAGAADGILALYRDHYYHFDRFDNETAAEVLILKGTQGGTATAPFAFDSWKRLWTDPQDGGKNE